MGNNILTAVFLSSVCSVGGLSEQSPVSRTVALEGQTALLPCTFTFTNIEHLTIEWTKNDEKDLSPNYAFTLRSGHEDYHMKNLKFQHRTHLFMDEVSKGNASLRISDVSLSDTGKYKCKIIQDSGQNEREVELFVGSALEPKFLEFSIEAEGVSLRCEASCWFPEPQMTFLDEQGKFINAEKSTTEQREGTGCFTVTGRITVQSAGRFICRVHQSNISLTRDVEIYVQTESRAEHVTSSSSCSINVAVTILVLVVVIICIVFRRKLSKLFKCVFRRRRKSWQPHSGRDIERQKYENGASTCEDDNIEHSNCEQTKGLNGPDQNQTSVSLSRSASVVSNSRERPPRPPVQENCSRPEPLNAPQCPKSTNPPDHQKTGFRIQRQNSAPAQLSSTSVKHRSRLTSLSHDNTPEATPLMEDSEAQLSSRVN